MKLLKKVIPSFFSWHGDADSSLTLHYEFAANKTVAATGGLGPTLTVSNDSDGTYFDSLGVLTQSTTNVARFDHSPIAPFESLGLLIEAAATNFCLHSGSTADAAWVASNMTKESDSVTDPTDTANTAVRLTATAANATLLQTITSGSANRSYSVYMKRVTGTGNIDITTDNGVTWETKTLTSEWQRFDIQASSVTNPQFGVRIVTDTDAIDFWGSQQETSNYSTSYIPTTTSATTRSQNFVDTTTVDWNDETMGTWYAEGDRHAGTTVGSGITNISTGSSADEIKLDNTGDRGRTSIRFEAASVGELSGNANSWVVGTTEKIAMSFDIVSMLMSVGGAAVITDSTIAGLPVSLDLFRVGARSGFNSSWNGHIKEIRYYNVKKSDDFLVALSNGDL